MRNYGILLGAFFSTFCLLSLSCGKSPAPQPTAEEKASIQAPASAEKISFGEKYLLTKTTSDKGLGCGPPDDFDCGYNRYSGYMALANIDAYEKSKDKKFLEYAVKYATTPQTAPPEWCQNCICNPPNDYDCGNGEDQAEMIDVFARLYANTGDGVYLKYAEGFAGTKPSGPPSWCADCVCGPPDDWDCGRLFVQMDYMMAYKNLYNAAKDPKYLGYVRNLADAWLERKVSDVGPRLLAFLNEAFKATNDKKYSDRIVKVANELVETVCRHPEELKYPADNNLDLDQSAYMESFLKAYENTPDAAYLKCAEVIAEKGPSCSIPDDWVCNSLTQQAGMIKAHLLFFEITKNEKYREFAKKLGDQKAIEAVDNQLYGYKTKCADFNCQDAEDNAFIGSALLQLEAAGAK